MPNIISLCRSHWVADARRFRFPLPPSAKFAKGQGVALSNASLYNSFFNISAANSNSTLTLVVYARFTKSPESFATLGTPVNSWTFNWTIPDGYYSSDALSDWIHYQLYTRKIYQIHPTTGNYRYVLSVAANSTQYAIQLSFNTFEDVNSTGYTLPSGCPCQYFVAEAAPQTPTLTLTTGLATLLGYTAGSYGGYAIDTQIIGTVSPQISVTTALRLHCNLVSSPYNNPDNILQNIPLTASYGSLVTYAATSLAYAPILPNHYSYVECYFTDSQTGTILTPYDLDITITLTVSDPPAAEDEAAAARRKVYQA